ncbi:ATP-binding protein [Xanthomonas sp. BRIP62415]|nr:ATP-binding protein [Xanthomonas sp. BRIP62415]
MPAENVEALIAAVLLHDCAMHLSLDGFFALLDNVSPASVLIGAERPWPEEFAKFEQEALRWDSQKLMSVFGDTEPAQTIGSCRNISDRQKMMVGEFLRRNHARLAHEIALAGVPGSSGSPVFDPFVGYDLERRDIFGLLARSHNMAIRSATDVLPRISRRRYLEIHCPFVMALLRIADYIQIDSARAPTQILQLRGLKSPLSRSEWAKHHAVLELHQLGDDPEALNVVAVPKDVVIFSGLRALFRDLQRELDESWALLGEVYGRFDTLSNLSLTVRRLVSNLDDADQFERDSKPGYIPKELRLTTASAELLHLLVGPLYGNDPSIGVREIIQNAIDAVTEMHHQQLKLSSGGFVPSVEVELDIANKKDAYLRVTDNGVGMSLEILEEYFLRAGASFRKSKWWAGEYSEESGESKIRRSGRFGVGALAAFLVGPVIAVTTRHFQDTTGFGYKFTVSLDDDLIEVKRLVADIGTSISVQLSGKSVDELGSDAESEVEFYQWYAYASPQVRCRIHESGGWRELTSKYVVAEPLVSQSSVWTPVDVPDFESIFWSYDLPLRRSSSLYCNGLYVCSDNYSRNLPKISLSSGGVEFKVGHPDLLVNDKSGRLPLNVQRDGIVEKTYPFQDLLESSIAESYAREMIGALRIKSSPENIGRAIKAARKVAGKFRTHRASLIGLGPQGWFVLESAIISSIDTPTFVLELFDSSTFDGYIGKVDPSFLTGRSVIPLVVDSSGAGASVGFIRTILDGQGWWGFQSPLASERVMGMRVFISDAVDVALKKKGGLPQYLFRKLDEVFRGEGWVVYEMGKPAHEAVSFEDVIREAKNSSSRAFAYAYMDIGGVVAAETVKSKFSKEWLAQVGSVMFHVESSLEAQESLQELVEEDDESLA